MSLGCGEEVRRTWRKIEGQATAAAVWVGEEMSDVLAAQVQGIGAPSEETSVSGATRGRIVAALQTLQSKVLAKDLKSARV